MRSELRFSFPLFKFPHNLHSFHQHPASFTNYANCFVNYIKFVLDSVPNIFSHLNLASIEKSKRRPQVRDLHEHRQRFYFFLDSLCLKISLQSNLLLIFHSLLSLASGKEWLENLQPSFNQYSRAYVKMFA